MYPYPIKDWRNTENYPSHQNLNQWAWEFLRRNPEYQEDIDRLKKGKEGFAGIYEFYEESEENGLFIITEKTETSFETARLEVIIKRKYNITDTLFSCIDASPHKPDEVFLRVLPHPPEDNIGVLCFDINPPMGVSWWAESKDQQTPVIPEHEYNFVIGFDVSKPIDIQIERARNMLMNRAEHKGFSQRSSRAQLDIYPNYIRVLDAVASRATSDEIAEVICPDKDNSYDNGYEGRKTILNWKSAAKKLRDGGYINLAYLAEKTK